MKVLVGISGGVDSSVAALLLKQAGYEVIGATMILYKDKTKDIVQNILDAKKICKQLGIEHHIINLEEEFRTKVINEFISVYNNGGTPNPCVTCNKYLKFGALWEQAQKLGCTHIATGHYAKIENGQILKSSSITKDQSYFLYGIKKEIIDHIIFPLDKFHTKEEVRKIAKDYGLEVYNKKDSQDICFINNNYTSFLEENIKNLPDKGNFILKDGTIIGQHKGLIYYTIGQRKGLGISYKTPLYVIAINKKNNTITLGEEKDLYQKELICTNINIQVDPIPTNLTAKIRYKSKEVPVQIKFLDKNTIKVIFNKEQRAITKGQSVVFYNNDILVGGGIIQ